MKFEIFARDIDRTPLSEPASPFAPVYRGLEWLDVELPAAHRPWPGRDDRLVVAGHGDPEEAGYGEIRAYVAPKLWVFPDRPVIFLCDQHADADAFLRSLVASGGIARTGHGDFDFVLTSAGRDAVFVIGGDCLDKGPENLRLLRVLKALIDLGAEVEILAGNHDLRFLVGLRYAGCTGDPALAHLFVRMGQKAVPLFKEVHDTWLRGARRRPRTISDAAARRLLFPPESWYAAFPRVASTIMPPARIEKEVLRIREKTVEMQARAARMGLSLGTVHAVVETCRRQFLERGGAFAWYFERMSLAYRAGSFLLVHAGVDDVVAEALQNSGVDGVNRWFRRLLETSPFDLYNGPVGNAFRTKYRPGDWPLSARGAADMHRAGLYAIVHGHRNILYGQRMVMREGLLNFECDASVDRNTRLVEGLAGPGGATTLIRPDGKVLGISTDFPYIKLFDPAALSAVATTV